MNKISYYQRVNASFGLHQIQINDIIIFTTKICFKELSPMRRIVLSGYTGLLIYPSKRGTVVELVTRDEKLSNAVRDVLFNICKNNAVDKFNAKYSTSWGR